MYKLPIQPRFSETDGLGHINNTVIPVWFEAAREPIFAIFNPTLNLSQWNLIIAKIEVEYLAQIHYPDAIEIRTYLTKIGNSSMHIQQQVLQNDEIVAKGQCVMVKYDYNSQTSVAITEAEKHSLALHLIDG